MKKPGAIDFLYEKIIRSGLAHKLTKYDMLAWLHAVMVDETILHRAMGVGASFFEDNIKEEDIPNFKLIYQRLQLFDDNQLEQHADNITKSLIEDHGYYALLFIAGLLKL
jgi:hypothetical protein